MDLEAANTMATANGSNTPVRIPWWRRLRLSLRMWILLVGVVGVVVGIQSRREFITPATVAKLAPVARLDKNDIWRIAWSRDRTRMAVVGWEKPVELRDPVSLKLLETIGNGKKIIHFAFSPIDDVIAYTGNDGSKTAVVLDRRSGKEIILSAGSAQPDVVFSPDGTSIVTGGSATEIRLWSLPDGKFVRQFDVGPTQGGLTPEFSPDGKILAVGHRNSKTSLFETATGRLIAVLPKESSQELQFDPRGQTLAVTYVDGSIALWRVSDGQLVAERKTQAEELYAVDWSPDGKLLATAGRQGKITIWDARDLSMIRELDAPPWVIRVKFSPDGLNLCYAGGVGIVGGKRQLVVYGIEGSLFSLLNRPSR
jgi:WD40 repeat protein